MHKTVVYKQSFSSKISCTKAKITQTNKITQKSRWDR